MPSVLRTIWPNGQHSTRSYCYSDSLASYSHSLGGDDCPKVEIQSHDDLYSPARFASMSFTGEFIAFDATTDMHYRQIRPVFCCFLAPFIREATRGY